MQTLDRAFQLHYLNNKFLNKNFFNAVHHFYDNYSNIVGTQNSVNIFYSLLKCFDMAFIKPRKTERKNQMQYCELKDNKANAVAFIHNVYILVLHSTAASVSLYYQKMLIHWSLDFPPLQQRIRGEVATSSLVYFKSGLSKFYLLVFTATFLIAPGF